MLGPLESAGTQSTSQVHGICGRSRSFHPRSSQRTCTDVQIVRSKHSNGLDTHVLPVPSTSKTGFQPNLPAPRGGTIFPSVRPSNSIGSVPGPALYAKVQSAYAAFVGNPTSSVFNPAHIPCQWGVLRARMHIRTFKPKFLQEELDVRSREAVECLETQCGVLRDTWSLKDLRCPSAFLFGNLFCSALQLRDLRVNVRVRFTLRMRVKTVGECAPSRSCESISMLEFPRMARTSESFMGFPVTKAAENRIYGV